MENEGMKYFVWISGLRGPEPQIWDDPKQTREGKPIKPLFGIEVSDTAQLKDLMELYPYVQ